MIELKDENIKGLDMTFELGPREQAMLASAVKHEWFDVLQKLMEQEVRLLNIKLLNLSDSDEILAAHAVAKGAGMFYAGLIQRLQTILQIETIKAAGIGTIDNPEQPPMIDEAS